jgi:hypothetical protein
VFEAEGDQHVVVGGGPLGFALHPFDEVDEEGVEAARSGYNKKAGGSIGVIVVAVHHSFGHVDELAWSRGQCFFSTDSLDPALEDVEGFDKFLMVMERDTGETRWDRQFNERVAMVGLGGGGLYVDSGSVMGVVTGRVVSRLSHWRAIFEDWGWHREVSFLKEGNGAHEVLRDLKLIGSGYSLAKKAIDSILLHSERYLTQKNGQHGINKKLCATDEMNECSLLCGRYQRKANWTQEAIMKTANVKAMVAKVITVGVLAGAFVMVAPAKAQAQGWQVGVQLGAPVYYRDDRRGDYWRHERQEEFERQQAYARQQAYLQHEAWERHEREEAYERQRAYGYGGYGFRGRDRDDHFDRRDRDGDRDGRR